MQETRRTHHRVHVANASALVFLPAASVQLVVTSPPYPMIEMWDACFETLDPKVGRALRREDGWDAFERMHATLDPIWTEIERVLAPGGFACINIGDATRTVAGRFALYPNHTRILTRLVAVGLVPLPSILWRKPTNAPNKFMGSGMLPAGAYVTLEHELVLIVRKGGKREFDSDSLRSLRNESALFWEERNQWFSDVWMDLRGARQRVARRSRRDAKSDPVSDPMSEIRSRSGAFPFELPYRLISMFSVKGDTVLDPFLGTGTTQLAAMATGRHSIGYEIEPAFLEIITESAHSLVPLAEERIATRLDDHVEAMRDRAERGRVPRHENAPYGFPVVTRQEISLHLDVPTRVEQPEPDLFEVEHRSHPDAAERALRDERNHDRSPESDRAS